MLDCKSWIETTFATFTWRQLLAGLFSCLALLTGLAGLSGSGKVVRALPEPGTGKVVKHWLDRDDPRAFAEVSRRVGRPDGAFDVAWISGSEISVREAPEDWRLDGKTGFEMTEVLATSVSKVGDKPLLVHEYLLQGARTGDVRRAVLDAARDPEIDAFIFSINPVWLFNDWLQFTQSNQRAYIVTVHGSTLFDWTIAARLLRPSEFALEWIACAAPGLRGAALSQARAKRVATLPFPFRKLNRSAARDGSMLDWWQKLYFSAGLRGPLPDSVGALKTHRSVMMMADTSPDAIGARHFSESVRTLAATGKPVILYVAPLNPLLKPDAEAVAKASEIIEFASRLVADVGANNVLLHTASVWDISPPLAHRDILHLALGPGVVELVITLLRQATGLAIEERTRQEIYGQGAAGHVTRP